MTSDTTARDYSLDEDGDQAYADVIRSVRGDDELDLQNPLTGSNQVQEESQVVASPGPHQTDMIIPIADRSQTQPGLDMGAAFQDALARLNQAAQDRLSTFQKDTLEEAERRARQRDDAHHDELERSLYQVELLKERTAALQGYFERSVALDEGRALVMERMAIIMRSTRILAQRFRFWHQCSSKRRAIATIGTDIIEPNRHKNQCRGCIRIWRNAFVNRKKAKREDLFKAQIDIVSRKLIETYELSLHNMRKKLAEAERQIGMLVQSKQKVERDMRQAFLRSVSTLNLEAMSMFNAELGEKKLTLTHPGESEPRRSFVDPESDHVQTTPTSVIGDGDLSLTGYATSERFK